MNWPKTQRPIIVLAGFIIVATLVWWLRPSGELEHFGLWSLLPAFATIVVCFISRNVILALLLGVFVDGLIIGRINIIDAFLIPSLGSAQYAQILLVYLWALGG